MIGRLRRKLIVACMISLAIVLTVILGGVNLMSYHKVVSDADAVLTLLDANGGAFPKNHGGQPSGSLPPDGVPPVRKDPFGQRGLSPETPYESRFFSVLLGEDGQVLQTDTGQIAAVDEEEAAVYARNVLLSGSNSGFCGNYRYLLCEDEQGSLIIFLDCGRSLDSFGALLTSCILVSAAGSLLVFLLLVLLSGRIVKPFSESYEKQKRFITDAGHELKTPLSIDAATAEIHTMDFGENEWIDEIQTQTRRLADLTNDLILLSRMEEPQPAHSQEFSLSQLAQQAVQSFQGVARAQGKTLEGTIQPELSMRADPKAVDKLLAVLLDNALKYALPGTGARCSLERQKNYLVFTVSNPCAPITKEQTALLFDRFYRTDSSRNSQTGGYGLGLSIAQAIVQAHRGRIAAATADGASLTVTVKLPI